MEFDVALAEEIWTAKYRFKTDNGQGDSSFVETSERVAKAVAEAEEPELRERWQAKFRDAIAEMQFIPAGRVLAGAGTGRSVTLFNCFVMGTIPDSLDGIFEHLKQAALTMQQGGGVGMDFSTVRPAGSLTPARTASPSSPTHARFAAEVHDPAPLLVARMP